jgi:hypothetical protein
VENNRERLDRRRKKERIVSLPSSSLATRSVSNFSMNDSSFAWIFLLLFVVVERSSLAFCPNSHRLRLRHGVPFPEQAVNEPFPRGTRLCEQDNPRTKQALNAGNTSSSAHCSDEATSDTAASVGIVESTMLNSSSFVSDGEVDRQGADEVPNEGEGTAMMAGAAVAAGGPTRTTEPSSPPETTATTDEEEIVRAAAEEITLSDSSSDVFLERLREEEGPVRQQDDDERTGEDAIDSSLHPFLQEEISASPPSNHSTSSSRSLALSASAKNLEEGAQEDALDSESAKEEISLAKEESPVTSLRYLRTLKSAAASVVAFLSSRSFLGQAATAAAFYAFHLTVLTQHHVVFPVELPVGAAVGWDSIAGMATLAAYRVAAQRRNQRSVDQEPTTSHSFYLPGLWSAPPVDARP